MNFELIFGVVAVLGIALSIWSNANLYKRCQRMNSDLFGKMMVLSGSVREELERTQKEIDELKAKLDKDVKYDPNTGKYFNMSLTVIKDIQERLTCLESGLEDAMRG